MLLTTVKLKAWQDSRCRFYAWTVDECKQGWRTRSRGRGSPRSPQPNAAARLAADLNRHQNLSLHPFVHLGVTIWLLSFGGQSYNHFTQNSLNLKDDKIRATYLSCREEGWGVQHFYRPSARNFWDRFKKLLFDLINRDGQTLWRSKYSSFYNIITWSSPSDGRWK